MTTLLPFILASLGAEPMSASALLNKMIDGRRAFATADLVWVETFADRPPEYRRSRYDGVNWTLSRIPDPDGVVQYSQIGEPFSCWDSSYLVNKDRVWFAMDGSQVRVHEDPGEHRPGRLFGLTGVLDARTVGLIPENHVTNLDELPSRIGIGRDTGIVTDEGNGVAAVTLKSVGGSSVTWWIDTQKSHNPVRITRRVGNKVISDARIELEFYDEHVWFPKTVEINRRDKDDRPEKYTATFTSAEFDRPNHPLLLTPEHIGVPPFSSVMRYTGPTQVAQGCWDGKDIITVDEMWRRLKNKTVTDQDLAELHRRSQLRDASMSGRWPAWYADPNYGITRPADVDEWEKYVRRFCLIRKCDDRQRASAKSILDDCRKMAVPLLAKAREAQAKEKDEARKAALLAPIDDIFKNRLVRRLETLLTIPQSQPSSQPGSNSPRP